MRGKNLKGGILGFYVAFPLVCVTDYLICEFDHLIIIPYRTHARTHVYHPAAAPAAAVAASSKSRNHHSTILVKKDVFFPFLEPFFGKIYIYIYISTSRRKQNQQTNQTR
jgi:hypothetical protein